MKKILLFILFNITLFYAANAQTFVSTDPSNKNVILEEFTGLGCQFCPDGHRIANELAETNPQRVFAINIHQGGYANGRPDYRSDFGNEISSQTGLTGYPAGTVNRQVFSGSSTALSRGMWTAAANQILAQPSPVNIAARATIDLASRELVLDVEMYFTSNSSASTNKLNVAILQNNVLGPQSGGSQYNPSQMVGSLYKHMHMLRHMITGQWGEDITPTTEGTFIGKQYKYTIPEKYRTLEAVLEDIEIVVYITEGQQKIFTGAKAEITYLNEKQPSIINIGSMLVEDNTIHKSCDQGRVCVTIKNLWEETINSFKLKYILDGNEQVIERNNQSIASNKSDTVILPVFGLSSLTNGKIEVILEECNDNPLIEVTKTFYYDKDIPKVNSTLSLKLATDALASETTFKVFNPDGTILVQGGPFDNENVIGIVLRTFDIKPKTEGCYLIEVYDSYGDGINTGFGEGYFELVSLLSEDIITHNDGKFDSVARYSFYVEDIVGINTDIVSNLTVFPNPVSQSLNITTSENIKTIELFNNQGQRVLLESKKTQINMTALSDGIYLLKITTDKGVKTEKIIKQ